MRTSELTQLNVTSRVKNVFCTASNKYTAEREIEDRLGWGVGLTGLHHWGVVPAHGHVEGAAGVLPQVHRGLRLQAPVASVEVVTICNVNLRSI